MQRYVCKLGRLLTRRLISSNQEIKNYWQIKNIPVRYFFQAPSGRRKLSLSLERGTTWKNKFTIQDLLQYINNGHVFYLKQLTSIFHTIDFSILSSDEAILLLKCCSTVPDSSSEQRNKVCQEIFTGLQNNKNLNIDVCNTFLHACCENNYSVNYKDFLSTLKCQPNEDTLKLLLKNVCQKGKINDAMVILELMKDRNIAVDSNVFNNLILAHAIEGGFDLAETVLTMMRSAHIAEDNKTRLALLTGLIRNNNFKDFKRALEEYPIRFFEFELLSVIEELGLRDSESWLLELYNCYKEISISQEFQNEVQKICIHLIHNGHPESAMNIYKEFVTPVPDGAYGFNLLKEMLHCDMDINTTISLAKDLMEMECNKYLLESLTEVALKFKYAEQSWTLLRSLNTLRPHYFWPLLAHGGKTTGENGVFSILKNIQELKVKPDAETLENYVLPFCDVSNLKSLVLKLQEDGFTVREILSPLMIVLLKQKRIRQAVNLCNLYNVNIFGDTVLELLSTSWSHTKDATSILTVLRRYCESNTTKLDSVGSFLVDCSNLCRNDNDFKDFLMLVKMTGESRLKISTSSGDILLEVTNNCLDESLKSELRTNINSILEFGLQLPDNVALIHPKNMDLDGLECHLIELQEKKMQTRGVLRRLIQMHAGRGNLERVSALRQVFLDSGYEESAGIKSSIMHSFVLGGHLEEAASTYKDLISSNPEFELDSFKFLDLAKLFITNNKFDEGYMILQNEISKSQKVGDVKSILRNCRELLNACGTREEIDKVFTLLVKNGLCKPTNIILGPLVRVHLKSGDLNGAVDKYIELSQKYRCTPLQLEILCAVAKLEKGELLQKVMRATESVHGSGPAQLGLISALAENGQDKALRKTLSISSVSIKVLLQKRCTRWMEEGKMGPLKCLLKACDRLPEEFVDIHFIYKCIFDLFGLNGDYAGATAFYESMPEESTLRTHFKKDLQRIEAKQYNVNKNEKISNTI